MAVVIAHRDGEFAAAVAAELQAELQIPVTVLPTELEALRGALRAQPSGWLIIDIDLLPAVMAVVRQAAFHVVVVSPSEADPRVKKLSDLGATVVMPDQVVAHMSQCSAQANVAAPVSDNPLSVPAGARTVVLHSPKGGAGVSTIAAHLAAGWASQGERVVLVDLASYGAQAMLCKVQASRSGFESLLTALEPDPEQLAKPDFDLEPHLSVVIDKPGRLALLCGAGPRLMDRVTPTYVSQLLERLGQMPFDRIIVDTPAEPIPRSLAALSAADHTVLIAVPDFTCGWSLKQFQGVLDVLRPRGAVGLVVNRVVAGEGIPPGELAARIQMPLLAECPEDPAVLHLNNHGVPWQAGGAAMFGDAVWQLATALSADQEELVHG